jgi:hypothetical protein
MGNSSSFLLSTHAARARDWHLGTMAVTAGVIAVASVGAVAAFFEVAAQSGRTADLDGAHHPQMIARQGMRLPVGRAVLSKNVGQLQSGPRH